MKKSRYTLFFPLKASKIILYNTLSGALYLIDEELKYAIGNDPDALPPDMRDDFVREWILIHDEVDEVQAVSVMRDELRYNSAFLQIMIMTTYECNLSCPYCYEKKDPAISLDPATTKRIERFVEHLIERCRPTHLDFLMYGGEPLLNTPPLYELTEYFARVSEETSVAFNVDMTTNGTLLTPQQVETLQSHDIRVVQVTLDGPQHLHDLTRRYKSGGGTYEDIISGLYLLTESTITPKIRINVHQDNVEAIDELLDDLKERGLSDVSIYYGIIRPMSRVCESYGNCIADSHLKSVIPSLWNLALEKGFSLPLQPQSNLIGCGMQQTSSFTIDPEGHLYKCVTMVGYPDLKIGTIEEDGSIPRWTPAYYTWMSRDPLSFPTCRECAYFPLCGGGCPMIAYARYGTYERGGCFETKQVLKEQLSLYLAQKYPEKL
ncbi:MAG: SPASM domain-containing protein [Theionarchaea archaeon]|nr:SPASM domain-containing protein [Theionarchaea archaeon]